MKDTTILVEYEMLAGLRKGLYDECEANVELRNQIDVLKKDLNDTTEKVNRLYIDNQKLRANLEAEEVRVTELTKAMKTATAHYRTMSKLWLFLGIVFGALSSALT